MWTPKAEATSGKRTSMVLKSSSRMIEELKGTDRTKKLHDNLEKTLPTSNPLRPAQTSAITTGLFYFEIELVSTSVSRAKICVQHQTNIQAPKKETQLRCFTFFTFVHMFSHFFTFFTILPDCSHSCGSIYHPALPDLPVSKICQGSAAQGGPLSASLRWKAAPETRRSDNQNRIRSVYPLVI